MYSRKPSLELTVLSWVLCAPTDRTFGWLCRSRTAANSSSALEVQVLAWRCKRGVTTSRYLVRRKGKGVGGFVACQQLLTSFCSSRGRASVSSVIQKERGAMRAVISIRSKRAASENRFSPYSRWNSRYFPAHRCWWRVKGVRVCQTWGTGWREVPLLPWSLCLNSPQLKGGSKGAESGGTGILGMMKG